MAKKTPVRFRPRAFLRTVYVDKVTYLYGRMIMCHMVANTEDELHAMAAAIGVARRHFQQPPKTKYWHYDICKAKRAEAIKRGAVEVTSREIIEICRKQ